jgi:hypothetical protein
MVFTIIYIYIYHIHHIMCLRIADTLRGKVKSPKVSNTNIEFYNIPFVYLYIYYTFIHIQIHTVNRIDNTRLQNHLYRIKCALKFPLRV